MSAPIDIAQAATIAAAVHVTSNDHELKQRPSFNPGILFWYWPYYQERSIDTHKHKEQHTVHWYTKGIYVNCPRYRDLREEYKTNIEEQDTEVSNWSRDVLDKAQKLIKTDKARRISSADRDRYLHYNIKPRTPLSCIHIQALIMWSDYTYLTQCFRKTFVPDYADEPIQSILSRHSSFYYFAKILRETVQYFGDNRYTQKGPFYCGFDRVLAIGTFSIRSNLPLSTSKLEQIASNFAGDDGMIITMHVDGDYDSRNHLRFFDCTWVSSFQEHEWLFFDSQHAFRLESIKHVASGRDFVKFSSAFYLFDCMLTGVNMEGARIRINDTDARILDAFIDYETNTHAKSPIIDKYPYILAMFRSFCNAKTEVIVGSGIYC